MPDGMHLVNVPATFRSEDQRNDFKRKTELPDYFLRWRILARMRRFLRPIFLRPFPVFLVPTQALSASIEKPRTAAAPANYTAAQAGIIAETRGIQQAVVCSARTK